MGNNVIPFPHHPQKLNPLRGIQGPEAGINTNSLGRKFWSNPKYERGGKSNVPTFWGCSSSWCERKGASDSELEVSKKPLHNGERFGATPSFRSAHLRSFSLIFCWNSNGILGIGHLWKKRRVGLIMWPCDIVALWEDTTTEQRNCKHLWQFYVLFSCSFPRNPGEPRQPKCGSRSLNGQEFVSHWIPKINLYNW